MIHYHGTPITPRRVLETLAGRHFCVSFARPEDAKFCHTIGQSVMLDNGAFSAWKRGAVIDMAKYYSWASRWLEFRTTWAVIPDIIDGTEADNDRLITEWFTATGSFEQAAPVWHLHESLSRLDRLVQQFDRVCFGSSGDFAAIGSNHWNNRMNMAFNSICSGSGKPPAWIHMLRGMSLSGSVYPFSSVDSTDVARNHHQSNAAMMAHKWDAIQCPATWSQRPIQKTLEEEHE